jgi:hypothetical protein
MGKLNTVKKTIFIDEPISVEFDRPGFIIKKPECPNKFFWRGETFSISELISEWPEFERKDKYSANEKEAHLPETSGKGSLGVGRFYFRVRTIDFRQFDLYYDRTIKSVYETKGFWILFQEIIN